MPTREYEPNYRERMIEWIWQRMSAAYPSWEQRMGPVWDPKRERERKRKPHLWPKLSRPARVWAEQIGTIRPDALSSAVAEATEPGRTELPTLPEFIALCHGQPSPMRRAPEPEETEQQKQQRLARGKQSLNLLHSMLDGSRTGA